MICHIFDPLYCRQIPPCETVFQVGFGSGGNLVPSTNWRSRVAAPPTPLHKDVFLLLIVFENS